MGLFVGLGIMFAGLIGITFSRGNSRRNAIGFEKSKRSILDTRENEIARMVRRQASAMLSVIRSPFDSITDTAWRTFVKWAQQGHLSTITPGYRLGRYLIDPRQLEVFGYMRNVRKVKYHGKEVYNGSWNRPYAEYLFLSDEALQYEVFSKIVANHCLAISERYREYIGSNICIGSVEKKITLSGLLAVAKKAGINGCGKWLASENDRLKFASTSDAFIEMNGVF